MKCCPTQTGAVISKLLELLSLHIGGGVHLYKKYVCLYITAYIYVTPNIHHYAFIFTCGVCLRMYVYI